jgi:hypothetical protein
MVADCQLPRWQLPGGDGLYAAATVPGLTMEVDKHG